METYFKPESAFKDNQCYNQCWTEARSFTSASRSYHIENVPCMVESIRKDHVEVHWGIELCVEDMRWGKFAKDSLILLRIIWEQVNVTSLEEVYKYFIDLSTMKVELARSQAQTLEDTLEEPTMWRARRLFYYVPNWCLDRSQNKF